MTVSTWTGRKIRWKFTNKTKALQAWKTWHKCTTRRAYRWTNLDIAVLLGWLTIEALAQVIDTSSATTEEAQSQCGKTKQQVSKDSHWLDRKSIYDNSRNTYSVTSYHPLIPIRISAPCFVFKHSTEKDHQFLDVSRHVGSSFAFFWQSSLCYPCLAVSLYTYVDEEWPLCLISVSMCFFFFTLRKARQWSSPSMVRIPLVSTTSSCSFSTRSQDISLQQHRPVCETGCTRSRWILFLEQLQVLPQHLDGL